MGSVQTVWDTIVNWIFTYGGIILYAAIVIVAGLLLLFILKKVIFKAMTKAKISEKIIKLVLTVCKVLIYAIIIMVVLNAFHVPMAAIVTMLSALGLAFSLAFKETLSNFAQGVLLNLTHPFKVGDTIETSGVSGTVKSIEIVYTRLLTPDNCTVLVPNSEMASAKIINFSTEPTRRADLTFSIGYQEDLAQATELITEIVTNHPLAHQDPAPVVRVLTQEAGTIQIGAFVWANTGADYGTLTGDIKEQVREAFAQNGIGMPLPHMDVSIISQP